MEAQGGIWGWGRGGKASEDMTLTSEGNDGKVSAVSRSGDMSIPGQGKTLRKEQA